jgi:hypothetical protein
MLTPQQLIEMFSDANRTLFLGKDLHDKCLRDGRKVSHKILEKRLEWWKSNKQFSTVFIHCGLNDVIRICNLSQSNIVDEDLSNKCFNDMYNAYIQQKEQLQSANNCSICLEYNKNGEVPNKIGCGHSFHYSCLNEWIKQGHKNCPECRQPITMLAALPSQTTVELFNSMKQLDKTFKKRYIKEMKQFMTPTEIQVFQEIFGIIEDFDEDKALTKTTFVILFLIFSFVLLLINKASAYVSTYVDPNYIPVYYRDETQIDLPISWTETAIMWPSVLIYILFNGLMTFKVILDNMRKK